MFQVGVLLLAAGVSRRFGSDKRAAVMPDGKSVLETTLENIKQAGLPFKLCLAPSDRALASVFDLEQHQLIFCHDAAKGMGETLAEGMTQIPDWQGTIIALGDMPWVQPHTYTLLKASVSKDTLCVPTYEGQKGNPVAFGEDFYETLRQSNGDRGARFLIDNNPGQVNLIAVDDSGILRDIDQLKDLHAD
jgi:molybdenum cofactor cytidylyltransferase